MNRKVDEVDIAEHWPGWFRAGSSDYISGSLYYSTSLDQVVCNVGCTQSPGIPADEESGLRLVMHLALLSDHDYQNARMSVSPLATPYSLCMLLQQARVDLTPCTWLIHEQP